MDQDHELRKFKWIVAAAVAFLFSGCYALGELRYALWGKAATATVTETYIITNRDRRGGETQQRVLKYRFQDAEGHYQTGSDRVAPESEVAENDEIKVQYIPGEELATRVEGNRNVVILGIFGACTAALAVFIFLLIREANEPVKGRRPSGRGR